MLCFILLFATRRRLALGWWYSIAKVLLSLIVFSLGAIVPGPTVVWEGVLLIVFVGMAILQSKSSGDIPVGKTNHSPQYPEDKVAYIRGIYENLDGIRKKAPQGSTLREKLDKLFDLARDCQPMSGESPDMQTLERDLEMDVDALREDVKKRDAETAEQRIASINDRLARREVMCKTSSKHKNGTRAVGW
ncbi:hypothetical protein FACS1894196_2390 [Clostridia bacterium]|nr:hypothetical protein FACS1894196_2390 [Clostridia bacterium]